jgi:hypothetical protein
MRREIKSITFNFENNKSATKIFCDSCGVDINNFNLEDWRDYEFCLDARVFSGGEFGGNGEYLDFILCWKCLQETVETINLKRKDRGISPIEKGEFDW